MAESYRRAETLFYLSLNLSASSTCPAHSKCSANMWTNERGLVDSTISGALHPCHHAVSSTLGALRTFPISEGQGLWMQELLCFPQETPDLFSEFSKNFDLNFPDSLLSLSLVIELMNFDIHINDPSNTLDFWSSLMVYDLLMVNLVQKTKLTGVLWENGIATQSQQS